MTNIKFKDPLDRLKLLSEINKLDFTDSELSEEIIESFIKGRKELVTKLKSFRRSQSSKRSWRINRYKIMKGIKKFHKSVAGKKFHRQLGRYLATRITESGDSDNLKTLISLSSLKTHLLLEMSYYMSLDEEVDYTLLIEYMIPTISDIEKKVLHGESLDLDEFELLLRSNDPQVLTEELSTLGINIDISELNPEDDSDYKFIERVQELSHRKLYDIPNMESVNDEAKT